MHDYPVYVLARAREAELARAAEMARHERAARGRWARWRAHRPGGALDVGLRTAPRLRHS